MSETKYSIQTLVDMGNADFKRGYAAGLRANKCKMEGHMTFIDQFRAFIRVPLAIKDLMKKDLERNFICTVCGEPVSRKLFPKYEQLGMCPDCHYEAAATDPERVG